MISSISCVDPAVHPGSGSAPAARPDLLFTAPLPPRRSAGFRRPRGRDQSAAGRRTTRAPAAHLKRDAPWLGWDAPRPPERGLPIGNLTSQWWGNLYLDGLDHFVTRTLRPGAYQRYMDDIVVLGDEGPLLEARERIAAWLAEHRGLWLKDPGALPRSTFRPLLYLGHRVTREDIALGPKARQRLAARIRRHVRHPERAAAAVRAYGALWMWGS